MWDRFDGGVKGGLEAEASFGDKCQGGLGRSSRRNSSWSLGDDILTVPPTVIRDQCAILHNFVPISSSDRHFISPHIFQNLELVKLAVTSVLNSRTMKYWVICSCLALTIGSSSAAEIRGSNVRGMRRDELRSYDEVKRDLFFLNLSPPGKGRTMKPKPTLPKTMKPAMAMCMGMMMSNCILQPKPPTDPPTYEPTESPTPSPTGLGSA